MERGKKSEVISSIIEILQSKAKDRGQKAEESQGERVVRGQRKGDRQQRVEKRIEKDHRGEYREEVRGQGRGQRRGHRTQDRG